MEQHETGKQKHIMDRVIELVEQRHHDAMNNIPMNKHEHKKKRRSSSAFPGQEVTMGTKSWCWNKQHQNQLLTFSLTMQVDVGILLIERHSSHNGELVLRLLLLSQSSVFVALTGCCLFTFVLGWINEGSIVKITINITQNKTN